MRKGHCYANRTDIYGNRTLSCKETARRRRKENGTARKWTNGQRKMEQEEMGAADDRKIFFVNPILGSYEVEYDEEDDESWIGSETGEPPQ